MRKAGEMMTNKHVEEANRLFDQAMQKATEKINKFEKTLWYRQLNYSEQMMSRQIILYYSEYMFDYHFQTIEQWDERATQDVLLDIFPHEIVAGLEFFEKVTSVLKKFFEFLYYQETFPQGLLLSKKVTELSEKMLEEVQSVLKNTPEEQLLELGEELGLDMGSLDDIDCLYRLAEMIQQDISTPQNIVSLKTRKI